jgi:hypothetical protein
MSRRPPPRSRFRAVWPGGAIVLAGVIATSGAAADEPNKSLDDRSDVADVTPSSGASEGCFPKCRGGYVCSPMRQCVSECNPPCGAGTECRAGECYAPVDTERRERTSRFENAFTVGVGAHFGGRPTPNITMAGATAIGGQHRFVVGLQLGFALFDSQDANDVTGTRPTAVATQFGASLGYARFFTYADATVGAFVVAQPQFWRSDRRDIALGAAIGGTLLYKDFVIQFPIAVHRVAWADNPFQRSGNAYVTPSILVGGRF